MGNHLLEKKKLKTFPRKSSIEVIILTLLKYCAFETRLRPQELLLPVLVLRVDKVCRCPKRHRLQDSSFTTPKKPVPIIECKIYLYK